MERFDKDGRWIIPLSQRKKTEYGEDEIRYVIGAAYCPDGCSILDPDHPINGHPSLRIKFKRPGVEGELAISAIEGDFTKEVLSGELEAGVKDDLYCPHCDIMFKTLTNCNCTSDADMVVIGLTPELDFNNAVTFCNVTGCENGTFVDSGEAIRHIRLEEER